MIGSAHTVPIKMSGKCGSVRVRLVPAPRGTGLVASPVSRKVLQLAGIGDCFTSSSGSTKTRGNFAKAVFNALSRTYYFLTPDWWVNILFFIFFRENQRMTITHMKFTAPNWLKDLEIDINL